MDRATAQGLINRISADRNKRAEDAPPLSEAVASMANQQLRDQAMRHIGYTALASLGVGAAGRGAVGLINLLRGPKRPAPQYGPTDLPLPYPAEPEEEAAEAAHEKAFSPRHRKRANVITDFLEGQNATAPAGVPWYIPGMALAAGGGVGLGWGAADAMLDARRKSERAKQLEEAREQFHAALMSQYRDPLDSVVKKSSELTPMERVGAGLDRIYDRLEKSGEAGNVLGGAAGVYGLYAGLSGLLAAKLMYDRTGKRSNRAIVEQALQRQARERYQTQPTPILARPEPVPVSDDDED